MPGIVSMPSWRLFEEQTAEYRESVLPKAVTARLAVEAASSFGWERWTGLGGAVLAVDRFGASAPGATMFEKHGFTADHVADRVPAVPLAPLRGVRAPVRVKTVAKQTVRGRLAQRGQSPLGFDSFRLETAP